MKTLDLYSNLIANWLNNGAFVNRTGLKDTDIVTEYNLIFTRSCVKKVYRVSGIKPDNVDLGFVDYIRDEVFKEYPNVEVMISVHSQPVAFDVNSDKFLRAFNRSGESYSAYKELYESQDSLAKVTGKTYKLAGGGRLRLSKDKVDELYQVFITHYHLYNHITSGGTVSQVDVFFEVCGKKAKEVKKAGSRLVNLLAPLNFGVLELKSANTAFLTDYGPAASFPKTTNKQFLPKLLFTDLNSAAFSTYKSRGLVGGSGLLMGEDVRTHLPFLINIFQAPSAQVFLMMGKTGSGKTYTANQLALSALAVDQYVTAIDIKGREWSKLDFIVEPKIITFDERNPSFVNTLRLDDLNATKENAHELFATAVRGTVNLLSLIVNLTPDEGSNSDLEMILREAVSKMYSMAGVNPDNPASFAKTRDMKYSSILPSIESLSSTITYTDTQQKMIKLARSRCHAYLGDSGIFSDAFKNEVSLGDILHSKFVIYEFNKNQNAMVDSLDALRIFMVQYLDSKKKAMLREQGKFLFCFYEELQRCDQFGNLLEYICADVTGSRSNNAVVVLLLNSLRVLRGERARDIRSNITSFFCGSVETNDIDTFREEFNLPWLADQLELFSDHPDDYRNCFVANVDTGKELLRTVYKVNFPDYIRKQLTTRTVEEDA